MIQQLCRKLLAVVFFMLSHIAQQSVQQLEWWQMMANAPYSSFDLWSPFKCLSNYSLFLCLAFFVQLYNRKLLISFLYSNKFLCLHFFSIFCSIFAGLLRLCRKPFFNYDNWSLNNYCLNWLVFYLVHNYTWVSE